MNTTETEDFTDAEETLRRITAQILLDAASEAETAKIDLEAKKAQIWTKYRVLPLKGSEDFRPTTRIMWNACRKWLTRFAFCAFNPELDDAEEMKAKWLWLAGSSGQGKTHCALQAVLQAERAAPRRINCRVYPDPDSPYDFRQASCHVVKWFDLRRAATTNREEYARLLHTACTADILLLDDIGCESASAIMADWGATDLEAIFDARFRNRGMWTVVTSQKTMEQIGQLSKRLLSRIDTMTTTKTRIEY